MADSHAHTDEVLAQRLGNRAHPAITRVATAALHPDTAGRQIHVVVNHDHALQRHLEVTAHAGDRFAAAIVESLRQREHRDRIALARLAVKTVELAPRQLRAARGGQPLDCHEPDVVARAPILFAGVAKPHDQPSRLAAGRRTRIVRNSGGWSVFIEEASEATHE
ncbi:MAG: hypothetical protein HY269_02850 [Deltaproteobacteria bacterium]|nr:hypothetical protein [Deltaproteobacteria bacterium]